MINLSFPAVIPSATVSLTAAVLATDEVDIDMDGKFTLLLYKHSNLSTI